MISLADLRARNITPVWQEAVAVVQELIHTVRATTGSAELLPDLEHIALIPNGDVVAMPGSPEPDVPVRHAAVMLKLLLENTPVPPELDAFVERNIAEPPQYDSVAEFSRNLAFFERPGRRADIERLVGRAMAAEQTRRADEELRRLKERASEVEHTVASPTLLETPKRVRTVPVPLAAAVVFALVVGLGWWWISRGEAPEPVPDAAAEATAPGEVADAAGEAGGEGAASGQESADPAAAAPAMTPDAAPAAATAPVREPSLLQRTSDVVRTAVGSLFGSGNDAAPAATAPQPPAERAAAPSRPASTRARPAPARASSASASAAASSDTAAAPASSGASATPDVTTPVAAAGDAARETAEASEANAVLAPAVEEAIIFTALDEEVMPPVLVRPVLPREPPPNVPPDQVGTIEVVVDEQGDVVSVRLISPANRYQERMLVSAAKMWKFRPAYKDGRPVRYRTRVRLTI